MVEAELADALDAARGDKDRSQFIRDVIAKEIRRCGIDLPEGIERKPDRVRVRKSASESQDTAPRPGTMRHHMLARAEELMQKQKLGSAPQSPSKSHGSTTHS